MNAGFDIPGAGLHVVCAYVSYGEEKGVIRFNFQVQSSQVRGGKDQGSSCSGRIH